MVELENKSGTKRRGRWKPGESGNPGGRPRDLAEIRELARSHAKDAIATLVEIARHGKKENARVAAAEALLDRGFGKPTQSMELSGPAGGAIEIASRVAGMTDDDLRAIIARANARSNAPETPQNTAGDAKDVEEVSSPSPLPETRS